MKPQDNWAPLRHSAGQTLPRIHLFLSPWGQRLHLARWTLSILLNSEDMASPRHPVRQRLGFSQEVSNQR